MSDLDLDLKALQGIVDLGPFKLVRCGACRGVSLETDGPRCAWCGTDLACPGESASPKPIGAKRGRRGRSSKRPRARRG